MSFIPVFLHFSAIYAFFREHTGEHAVVDGRFQTWFKSVPKYTVKPFLFSTLTQQSGEINATYGDLPFCDEESGLEVFKKVRSSFYRYHVEHSECLRHSKARAEARIVKINCPSKLFALPQQPSSANAVPAPPPFSQPHSLNRASMGENDSSSDQVKPKINLKIHLPPPAGVEAVSTATKTVAPHHVQRFHKSSPASSCTTGHQNSWAELEDDEIKALVEEHEAMDDGDTFRHRLSPRAFKHIQEYLDLSEQERADTKEALFLCLKVAPHTGEFKCSPHRRGSGSSLIVALLIPAAAAFSCAPSILQRCGISTS